MYANSSLRLMQVTMEFSNCKAICALIIHGIVRDIHFSGNYEDFITLAKSFNESGTEIVALIF